MKGDYQALPGSTASLPTCRIRRPCTVAIVTSIATIAVAFCVVLVIAIPSHQANTSDHMNFILEEEKFKILNELAVSSLGLQNFCMLPASVAAFRPDSLHGTWYEIATLQTPGAKVLKDCHCRQLRFNIGGSRGNVDYTCSDQNLSSHAEHGTMKTTRPEGVWTLNVKNRSVLWSVPIQTVDLAIVQECDRELSRGHDDYYSATRILARTPRSLDELQAEFLTLLHGYMGYSPTDVTIASSDKCTF